MANDTAIIAQTVYLSCGLPAKWKIHSDNIIGMDTIAIRTMPGPNAQQASNSKIIRNIFMVLVPWYGPS